ncbi:MAG: TonB-dependent receptor [Saprospiraceae bacterium]|nr:TonB-dependent receptor [Saprospiraceae bacterium]
MIKTFTLFLLSFIFHQVTLATEVNFRVINKKNQLQIEDVWVLHTNSGDLKFSNIEGQVRFDGLLSGISTFQFSAIGFETKLVSISLPAETSLVDIVLEETMVAIEEIVVEGNALHKKNIIGKLDIGLRPTQNSQEILRMVPGLFIGQHAGGGKAEQIFLRGFDVDHGTDVQLTVDDMPVNMVSHAHGQGYADLHFVIPELVDKVDFNKGPYLAEKGNFTTAGWVNLKTKNALDENIIKAEVGQYDLYRLYGGLNLLSPGSADHHRSAYIASEYKFSNGFFEAPQQFNMFNITGKYIGELGRNNTLQIGLSHFSSQWNHSGQIPNRAVENGTIGFFGSIDPTEGGKTSRSSLTFQTLTPLQKGLIKNQIYWVDYNFELYSNFTFFLEDSINGDQIRQKERRNLMGYNGSMQSNHTLGGFDGEFHTGIQFRYDFSKDNELAKTTNRSETRNQLQYGNIREANLAVFIAEQVTLSKKWNVELGLRLEKFFNTYQDYLDHGVTSKASSFNVYPKCSAFYQANKNMQLYWKLGKGFHSNDTRVVVLQKGKMIAPAAYGSDLGMIWKPGKRMMIQPAIWYLWMDQEFVYVGDAGIVETSGRSQRLGIDLSARYQLAKNWFADLDLNLANARAIANGSQEFIPLAPVFTSVGGLNYQNSKGLSGSIRFRYMGDRPANETNDVIAEGYTVFDLQFSYRIGKIIIGTQINNLFNTRWKETQFNTMSRLREEARGVEEIHFTPGSPFYFRLSLSMAL